MATNRRVLVCGWSGAGNVGDELLTRAAIALAAEAGIKPVVLSVDHERTRHHHPEVEVVTRGVRSLLTLANCDAVWIGPGGIIQDSSSVWSLPMHVTPALVARIRGRSVIGVGLGADPLRRRSSRWLLARALRTQPVTVRDPASQAVLAQAGIHSEIDCDLAVEILAPRALGASSGVTVAVGPNAAPGRIRRGRDRLVSDSADDIATLVDRVADRVGGPVRAVLFRGERDRAMADDIAARTRHSVTVDDDPATAVDAVWNAAAVVTSRYHAALVGAIGGATVVAHRGQAKLRSLINDPIVGDRMVGLDRWDQPLPDRWPTPGTGVVPHRTGANRAAVASLGA